MRTTGRSALHKGDLAAKLGDADWSSLPTQPDPRCEDLSGYNWRRVVLD